MTQLKYGQTRSLALILKVIKLFNHFNQVSDMVKFVFLKYIFYDNLYRP